MKLLRDLVVRQRILVYILSDEHTVAGLGVVFKYPLGSVQTSHFTDVAHALLMGTSDFLGRA